MPRTRAAVQGLDPARPWSEVNDQLALLDLRLQSLYGALYAGLRLKGGTAPDIKPYPVPQTSPAGGSAAVGQQQARRADPRKQAYLERFAPPSRRKHLQLVKAPPTQD